VSAGGGVEGIYIGSGVTVEGKPFCHVTVQMADGTLSEGQLDPDTVRKMALDWLMSAEAAVHDSAVYKALTESMEIAPETAAVFIADLRNHRTDADTMTEPPEAS
jgi:hypothetical protein